MEMNEAYSTDCDSSPRDCRGDWKKTTVFHANLDAHRCLASWKITGDHARGVMDNQEPVVRICGDEDCPAWRKCNCTWSSKQRNIDTSDPKPW